MFDVCSMKLRSAKRWRNSNLRTSGASPGAWLRVWKAQSALRHHLSCVTLIIGSFVSASASLLERMVLELRGRRLHRPREEVPPDRKSLSIASRSRLWTASRNTAGGSKRRSLRLHSARRQKRCAVRTLRRRASRSGLKLTALSLIAAIQRLEVLSCRLSVATADTGKLIAVGSHGRTQDHFQAGYRYKKAAVTFLELVPAGRVQRGLFDQLPR